MKELKKIKIIGGICVFLLCFLLHFLYDWAPNFLFSIISPVNESIWEHMKLILTSYVLVGCAEYFWIRNLEINKEKILWQLGIVPLLGIVVYLAIYLPLFFWLGENMIVSIGLLFLIIGFEEFVSHKILTKTGPFKMKYLGGLVLIILYFVFGYLTYYPCKNFLFYDMKENKYGINIQP